MTIQSVVSQPPRCDLVQSSKSSDKRNRILQAAVKVFAAKGFYVARVSDVAREAGVADGTIYLYFASKGELLRGLFEENMGRIIERLRSVAADTDSASKRLERIWSDYVVFVQTEPELAEVLTVELRESGKFMNEFAADLFGTFLRLIVDVIAEGQAQGEIRSDVSARTVARLMFGAFDELSLSWVMSKNKWDLDRSGREALMIFLAGLQPSTAAKKPAG